MFLLALYWWQDTWNGMETLISVCLSSPLWRKRVFTSNIFSKIHLFDGRDRSYCLNCTPFTRWQCSSFVMGAWNKFTDANRPQLEELIIYSLKISMFVSFRRLVSDMRIGAAPRIFKLLSWSRACCNSLHILDSCWVYTEYLGAWTISFNSSVWCTLRKEATVSTWPSR